MMHKKFIDLHKAIAGLVMLLVVGCATNKKNLEHHWPLHSGSREHKQNIYKYYEGPERPLEELAILQVRAPVGLLKMIPGPLGAEDRHSYSSGDFALLPERQTIELAYLKNWGRGYTHSIGTVPVDFRANPRRVYRTFYAEGVEVWHAMILDITDDVAIDYILENAPHQDVRKQALELVTLQETIVRVAQKDSNIGVRRVAIQKLTDVKVLKEIATTDGNQWIRSIATKRLNEINLGRG